MSEIDLASLAVENGQAEDESKKTKPVPLTPMQEANEALRECKFGWFQIRLMFTSFFGISSAILIGNTTAYILSNAECDLNMNLLQKGVLNAMSFVGMFLSTVVSGFLSDTFGRKLLLVVGFSGTTLFTVTTALSQSFLWICISKFLEGVAFAAAFSPLHAYTSECCHTGIRDRLVLWMSSYAAIGQIWLALYSWAVLTQNWRLSLFNGGFVLNTWNFYLLISAIAPLLATILYSLMPESPKFLVQQHRYKEAREALTAIYKENTRKPADTFPYKDLWKNREKEQTIYEDGSDNKGAWDAFTKQLVVGFHNCKPLFKSPLLGRMVLFCALNFLIMFMMVYCVPKNEPSERATMEDFIPFYHTATRHIDTLKYNVFRLWFPQLSTIVEYYSKDPAHNTDLCSMLEGYVHDTYTKNKTVSETCIPNKSGTETYINSVILGLICLPPFMFSGILVNKLGKKSLLIGSAIITIATTLGIRWSIQKYEVVGLIALDVSMGQVMMSLMQATTVEVFPTSTRSLSVSFLMMAGRTGTLVGNVIFPLLLHDGCNTTFFTMSGIMITVTILLFWLPSKKKPQ